MQFLSVRYLTDMEDYQDIIKTVPPFHRLSAQDSADFFSNNIFNKLMLKKGQYLHNTTELQQNLIVLFSGEFISEILSPSGKVLSVRRVPAPNAIAATLLFKSEASNQPEITEAGVAIRAVTDSSVLQLEKHKFRSALGKYPGLLDGFLEFGADRFYIFSRRMHYLVLGSIRQKLALYLLELPRTENDTVRLSMSVTDLANHFAVERPSLSTVLSQLEQENFITRQKNGVIHICNPEGLERIIFK